MKKRVEELVFEIKQVHEQYLDEVGKGGHKVWPRSIKDRVFELCELVGSIKETARLCGLSSHTVYQWRSDMKLGRFKSLTVIEKIGTNQSPLVTVPSLKSKSLIEMKTSSPKSSHEFVTVTVVTPRGYRIEGLSSGQVVDFLKKLDVK